MKRVAVLMCQQESNSFNIRLTTIEDFKSNFYCLGTDVITHFASTPTTMGAFLDVLGPRDDIEIVPILATSTISSGGPLTQEAIAYISNDIRESMCKAGRLDGVLIAMHGATLDQYGQDPEGKYVEIIRQCAPQAVIFATGDLHGYITKRKFDNLTGIVGFRHYPHDDAYDTGIRAAYLLVATLDGKIRPVMAMARAPMLVPCNNTESFVGSFKRIVDEEHRLEDEEGLLSVSTFVTQPWLDAPEMSSQFIAIADADASKARDSALSLAKLGYSLRKDFAVQTYPVEEAIRIALASEEKVIILDDTADAPGGGSTGDSPALLKGLLEAAPAARCLVGVTDPVAAQEAAAAGVGAFVKLTVGNRIDTRRGAPIPVSGRVKLICDGRFLYRGKCQHAGTWASMGLSAVVEIGVIWLMLSSIATYEWDDAQYRCAGINVDEFKIVGLKNPISYKKSLAGLYSFSMILDTKGPCSPNLTQYSFTRLPSPLYPFDDIASPQIEIFSKE